VVPYSLYRSRHSLGTWLSSIRSFFSMYSAVYWPQSSVVLTRYTACKKLSLEEDRRLLPCMFLRHARLMPRLSGYRVSSMSARARPDAFFFLSEEEWQAQQANKQKEQESSSPCMMVGGVGYLLFWFAPHRTASSRTWLQQRTPPSSILRRPSVSSALQRNASTLTATHKHAVL
jgi:hypothetical protein